MSMSMILASGDWRHNGDLIADVFRLPYLATAETVVDLTYGEGKFWTQFQPSLLVKHDRKVDGVDFRSLPECDSTYDIAVFDPPYTHASGRRAAKSMSSFTDRYGLDDAPTTWGMLLELILAGFDEAIRVTRHGGHVLVKSMPYVASGRLRHTPYELASHAEGVGSRLREEFVMVRQLGPDTARRANGQQSARHNYSVLQVYEMRKP